MSRELRAELPVGWEKRLVRMITGSGSRCISASVAAKRLGVWVEVLLGGLEGHAHFRVERKTGGLSIRPNWGLRVPAELR
jgi:hypothetical protein